MWPFIVNARKSDTGDGIGPPPTLEARSDVVREVDVAMADLRRAVYHAPRRDVPPADYDGWDFPSRLARALSAERANRENE